MSRSRASRPLFATVGLVAALTLAACSSGDAETAEETPQAGATSELETLTPGVLTIATGEPAYSPWVENDDPASGEGFEAAVAAAVAEELGFAPDDVVWVRSTFDSAIAPGPKDWDLNLQQFSITEERRQAVDFSSPYYVSAQAIITTEGSAAADAASIADLADVRFGVQVGTTSATAVEEVIAPTADVSIYNSSEDVVQALASGQVEAIVTDLPQALYLAAVEIEGGTVIGQLEGTDGGDELAFVLPLDSPLTDPVSAAIDALWADGTLDEIAATWLSTSIDVPVLQ